MPDRAGTPHPNADVSRPSHPMPGGLPEQVDGATRQAWRRWLRPGFEAGDQGKPGKFGYGDLFESGVAVAALLAMVALDVTLWLAIPLAVVTYIAVTLLRPARDGQVESLNGSAAQQPGDRATADTQGDVHGPDARAGNGKMDARFGLTPREQELLPLLAQRLTDREIAERLSISPRTAMNHTANILGKLGLASRRDIADFVTRHALQPPSAPAGEDE